MSQSSFDFLNIFTRAPGDLLYFLVVIAVTQAGLVMALGHRLRRPTDPRARRYAQATTGIVIAWVLLMFGALFTLLARQESNLILPPLERVVNVVTILLLGWVFLSADRPAGSGRAPNVILLVLLAVAIIGYMMTGVQWVNAASTTDFNLSSYGVAWAFVPAVLGVLGVILTLLYFRSIPDAPLKLVFFLLLVLGYGGTVYLTLQGQLIGNYSGPARLSFAAALTIMPAVIYRMIIGNLLVEAGAVAGQAISPLGRAKTAPDAIPSPRPVTAPLREMSPVERESVQLMKALGLILDAATPANIPEQIVQASLEVLKADVVALLKVQDANYADVVTAYDRAMGHPISSMALNLDSQPTLVNAIERHAQRPLLPDRNAEELEDLYSRLDIDQIGPVYFQPLAYKQELVAVLVVAMPYSQRELLKADEELLKGIGVISAGLLALSYAAQEARVLAEERAIHAILEGVIPSEVEDDEVIAARKEMEASLQLARDQITQLSQQVTQLKLELDDERSKVTATLEDSQAGASVSQRVIALHAEQQKLLEERDMLARRLQEAEAALAAATATDNADVANNMMAAVQREKADLEAQRDRLQSQLDNLRLGDRVLLPQEMQELVNRMAAEKAQLETESAQLRDRLTGLEAQLEALGIEGGASGLAQLIGQLYEQRATLQQRFDTVKSERDRLLQERSRFEDNISKADDFDSRIQNLQNELRNLAADREAAYKQRDKLRTEREELRSRVESLKQHRTRLLAQSAALEIELTEAVEEMAQLRGQLKEASEARSQLAGERDRAVAEKQALELERDQLTARAEGDRTRLQQVGDEGINELQRMIGTLAEQRSQLEGELIDTRQKLEETEQRLERSVRREMAVAAVVDGEEDASGEDYHPESPELLVSLVQELRTPMTSITGYVDLLLGESAGILGEMQRKFLQRVSANVTRLVSMVEDLVHITELDTGQFQLVPEPMDIVTLIEDSITNASNQFREKGLTVHLNLEEDLPSIRADRDAISQIVGQLLTNAYLVSPPDTEIFITTRRQPVSEISGSGDEAVDSLFVSVEDRGGGITEEDEARVFARKYKAENPLIQGLGDTGVGLSIARALVEAHGGRLWLETRPEVGSIFCFALPLKPLLETEEG